MPDKTLIWVGSSLSDLQDFPARARRLAGFQLRRVQHGLEPDDWKPMKTVGPGVREIRIHIAGAHRVFYVTTRPEAIYVLHAFEKKTRKTSATDVRIGRARLRDVERMRPRDDKAKAPLRSPSRRAMSSGISGSRRRCPSTSSCGRTC